MAFSTETIALWNFNQSLYDSVANNNFTLYDEDPYQVGPPVTGLYTSFLRFNLFLNKYESIYGLDLSNNTQYETNFTQYVSGDFTLAFWMKTTSVLGFVRHFITHKKTPKTDAVISKSEKAVVSEEEILETATFVIIEEASTEITNKLVLLLSADGTSNVRIESNEYTPGLHHYVVTYDSLNQLARIDLDGIKGTSQAAPGILFGSTNTLKINSTNPNYLTHQASGRTKLLRDIYFKVIPIDDESESLRNVKYGVEYVTNSILIDTDFVGFGTSYTQPNTIATTSIIANGSNVFIGRSNGDLLKGEQGIWDNEFVFNLDKKNNMLNNYGPSNPSYSDNGMTLSQTFVKV